MRITKACPKTCNHLYLKNEQLFMMTVKAKMLVFVKRFIWNQEEGKLFYFWTKIMVKTIRNNWKKESTFSNALKKQSWLSLQFISKKNIATPVFFFYLIRDFIRPKSLNTDAIYLEKETHFVKHHRSENVCFYGFYRCH